MLAVSNRQPVKGGISAALAVNALSSNSHGNTGEDTFRILCPSWSLYKGGSRLHCSLPESSDVLVPLLRNDPSREASPSLISCEILPRNYSGEGLSDFSRCFVELSIPGGGNSLTSIAGGGLVVVSAMSLFE